MRIDNFSNEEVPTKLKNRGFFYLEALFLMKEWKIVKNDFDHIVYMKPGNETDYFEIKLTKTEVCISIPVKNSKYQYVTSFNNYFDASEYIEEHLVLF
jgi:hypothetical protein